MFIFGKLRYTGSVISPRLPSSSAVEVGFKTQVGLTPGTRSSVSDTVLPSKNISPPHRQAKEGGHVTKHKGIPVTQGLPAHHWACGESSPSILLQMNDWAELIN